MSRKKVKKQIDRDEFEQIFSDAVAKLYNSGKTLVETKVKNYPGSMVMYDIPEYTKHIAKSEISDRVAKYNPNDLLAVNDEIDRTKIVNFDPKLSDKYNESAEYGIAGFTYSTIPYPVVLLNEGPNSLTFLHELRHRLGTKINLTPEQEEMLEKAYSGIEKDEREATNTEFRKSLLISTSDDDVDLENLYIDKVPTDLVLDNLSSVNGYARDYVEDLRKNHTKELLNKIANDIKKAAMYVPLYEKSPLMEKFELLLKVPYFKNGKKIHIKESLKGSFTRYCGGNVTSECIARGKASPDPRIRKKATFAANARKWKHLKGGNLKHNDSNSDVIDYANIEVNPDIFNPYSNAKLGLLDSYKVFDNK